MQDTAIFAAADNGVIGGIARAVAIKFVVNFPLQLILKHPRTAFFHRADMRQRANFPGAAQDSNLFRRFEQAHLMDDRSPVSYGGRRGQILAGAFTQLLQRSQNNLVGIRIFALRVVHHIQTIKQLKELLVDFAKRQRPVNAQFFRRGILS